MWKDNIRHHPSAAKGLPGASEEELCRRLSFHRSTGEAGAVMWRESVRYFSSGEFLQIGRWLPSFGLAQPIRFLQAPCPPIRTPRTEHQNFLTQPPTQSPPWRHLFHPALRILAHEYGVRHLANFFSSTKCQVNGHFPLHALCRWTCAQVAELKADSTSRTHRSGERSYQLARERPPQLERSVCLAKVPNRFRRQCVSFAPPNPALSILARS
ncbi:MAG: hypothetical protein ACI87O_002132 [Planctomycetota bacterium]|jgi:hypothetical protein